MFENKNQLALFGGSFDPVHFGHFELAKAVLDKELANEVMFIPAGNPPHKQDRKLTAASHRLEMIRRLVEPCPEMSFSDYEISKGKSLSYTIQTLRAMSHIFPDKEISLIIGMDTLLDFHNWNSFQKILENYRLIVFTRPGYTRASFAELHDNLGQKHIEAILENIIDDVNVDLSSTEIRKKISNGEDVSSLVPKTVLEYINENNLYRD